MIWYLYVYVFMLYMCHVTVLWKAYLFGPKWSINYYYYYEIDFKPYVAAEAPLHGSSVKDSLILLQTDRL